MTDIKKQLKTTLNEYLSNLEPDALENYFVYMITKNLENSPIILAFDYDKIASNLITNLISKCLNAIITKYSHDRFELNQCLNLFLNHINYHCIKKAATENNKNVDASAILNRYLDHTYFSNLIRQSRPL